MAPRHYQMVVDGQLDEEWAEWFVPLIIYHTRNHSTVIEGEVADQAALHGLLNKVFALGLTLLAVNCLDQLPIVQIENSTVFTQNHRREGWLYDRTCH